MGVVKINQLPDGSGNLTSDDLLIFMDDPSGIAVTKRVSASALRSSILNEPANLILRNGLNSELSGIIPLQGEPVWATDTNKLVIGDASTYGGILINAVEYVKPYAPSFGFNIFQSGHYVSLDNVAIRDGSQLRMDIGMSTIGNTRGMGAVDLSMSRTNANFVASGNYSFIGGGLDGQTIGNNSASLCGGKTTEDYMLSIGSNKNSSLIWGSGTYCDRFLLSIAKKTTSNTLTTLSGGTSNATLTMPINTALFATAQIAAIEETSGSGVAHFYRKFTARRFLGNASVLDFSTIGTDYNPSGYTIPTGAGAAGGLVAIRVTGGESTTLRWICTIDGMMVSLS